MLIMNNKILWASIALCILVLIAFGIYPFILTSFPSPWPGVDWESRSLFGGSYGALNTLFTGLAFVGVVIALLLQCQALSLQRQEMSTAQGETDKKLAAITAGAQLTALTAMFNYSNNILDLLLRQAPPKNASTGLLDRLEREQKLWIKKQRLLHKEMVRLATKLQDDSEKSNWPGILLAEKELAEISGGDRPYGPDTDEFT